MGSLTTQKKKRNLVAPGGARNMKGAPKMESCKNSGCPRGRKTLLSCLQGGVLVCGDLTRMKYGGVNKKKKKDVTKESGNFKFLAISLLRLGKAMPSRTPQCTSIPVSQENSGPGEKG